MKIVPFDSKTHDRSHFFCEEESLTKYIKKQAGQDVRKKLAVCFVLLKEDDNIVKGYYTLSNESLNREDLPDKYKNKVPGNYKVPVTLLGRLARDVTMKGKGAGEFLLIDALKRTYRVAKSEIGSMAVVVDPISENAKKFYHKYGFILLPESGKMFLPMKVLNKLFE